MRLMGLVMVLGREVDWGTLGDVRLKMTGKESYFVNFGCCVEGFEGFGVDLGWKV